jgi:hypothetical protein
MGDLAPHLRGSFSQLAIVVRSNIMTGDVEVSDWIVDRGSRRSAEVVVVT